MRRLVAAAACYLIGSIPVADIAARLGSGGKVDLRAAGSGNPGGANVAATVGKGWGLAVVGVDITKGALACAVSQGIAGTPHIGGPAAVIGHCHPVWSGFKGGKGVATSTGQLIATMPRYAPVDMALAGVVAKAADSAFVATAVAGSVWVAAATVQWGRGKATVGLPIGAAITYAVAIGRFAAERR